MRSNLAKYCRMFRVIIGLVRDVNSICNEECDLTPSKRSSLNENLFFGSEEVIFRSPSWIPVSAWKVAGDVKALEHFRINEIISENASTGSRRSRRPVRPKSSQFRRRGFAMVSADLVRTPSACSSKAILFTILNTTSSKSAFAQEATSTPTVPECLSRSRIIEQHRAVFATS